MRKTSLALCAVLFCSLANAAEQDNTEEITHEKVVVSASGFEQNADENLRNVIVIDAKTIREHGYISVRQALERTAAISFVDTGLGRNIDMRGQGSKANVAVKVMVDNKAINVLDNSHGVTPIDSVSIDNIQRIEIIPGGGSVLYGNGTRGGVINIITKKIKEDSASVGVKFNSYDKTNTLLSNLNLGLSKKLNDTFAFSTNLDAFKGHKYRKGDKEKGFYSNSKLYADIGGNTNLTLNYNFYESTENTSDYLSKAQIDKDPRQKADGNIKVKTTRPELSLDVTHKFSDQWELNMLAFWQKQKRNYEERTSAYNYNGLKVMADETGSSFEDEISGVNLKAKYSYMPSSYLVFGYDFKYHEALRHHIVSYGNVSSGPATVNSHIMTTNLDMKKQTHSLFVLNSHAFSDNFSLSTGARYERADYKSDRSYHNYMNMTIMGTPRITDTTTIYGTDDSSNNYAFELTPTYEYSNTGRIYAKYERGFISPSPSQLTNRRTGANPYYASDLEPETFDTFEIGVKDYLFDFSDISLTLYYTKTKDEITYTGDPHATMGAYWQYYNLDQTRRIGAELNLAQNFDKLTLTQSMSYIDAKVTKGVNDGKRVPYVSKVKATAGANYEFSNDISGFVNLTYLSKALDGGKNDNNGVMQNNEYTKSYFLTDIGLNYTHKGLNIFAGVKNLFDKEYYTYQSAIDDNYLPGEGRSYYVEVKYNF
ncbi:MAG: TonB-dependent receptor [Campylobacter sp.]|nr:TonB-dependent receptor [Campylobacter sp.]